jgi:hypothetical protein
MDCATQWVSRQDRRALSLSGSISLANGRSIQVSVTNASREGCLVYLAETLPIGETVMLECAPHGVAPAMVRWALPGQAGLRFSED